MTKSNRATKLILFTTLFLLTIFAVIFLTSNIFASAFAAESYVANVVIFSAAGKESSSSFGDMGHAFILIENKTNREITVGKMKVTVGGFVTIGTWGNKSDHKGLWYNLESFLVNKNGRFDGRVSIEQNVTATELNKINNYILEHDYWKLFSNCSTFATGLWNSFSTIELSCGTINTPAKLKKSIMQHNYMTNRKVLYNSNVGYYNENTFIPSNPFVTKNSIYADTSFTYEEYLTLLKVEV